MANREARDERLQFPSALGPGQGAQVVPVDREQVVNADEGGIVGAHLFRHRLAPQPLLQRVETRCLTALHASAHEQFRSEEHTSELQSLMRISYAVFCLKKKTNQLT